MDKQLGDPAVQPLLLIYKSEAPESADAGRSEPKARDRTGYCRPEFAGGATNQTYAIGINGIGEGGRSSA